MDQVGRNKNKIGKNEEDREEHLAAGTLEKHCEREGGR